MSPDVCFFLDQIKTDDWDISQTLVWEARWLMFNIGVVAEAEDLLVDVSFDYAFILVDFSSESGLR